MVVVVAGIKGGTGKTTIAVNLAVIRAQNASDVLLIDADPQNSAYDFAMVREEEALSPEIVSCSMAGKGLDSEVRKLINKFDDIIIDVGGRDSSTLRSALLIADVLAVPIIPSQLDSWVAQGMNDIVGEVKEWNNKLNAIVFLNKIDTNPKIGLTAETIDFLKEFKHLKYVDANIGYRVAFRKSVAGGMAVTELKNKKDTKSVTEIKKLYQEIFKYA